MLVLNLRKNWLSQTLCHPALKLQRTLIPSGLETDGLVERRAGGANANPKPPRPSRLGASHAHGVQKIYLSHCDIPPPNEKLARIVDFLEGELNRTRSIRGGEYRCYWNDGLDWPPINSIPRDLIPGRRGGLPLQTFCYSIYADGSKRDSQVTLVHMRPFPRGSLSDHETNRADFVGHLIGQDDFECADFSHLADFLNIRATTFNSTPCKWVMFELCKL
ncbi:hypothetical protein BD410DRAFT_62857 [Rickenella mellea]|uniref:Uncharacterized protein n=1 Tax=Rickenella mellea TaxID=50990 RepID=A0A4Y7QBR8_9AGAM|nr:hypothetical protein BD410DRAFT_62857 [Rickenella mellea]